MSSLQGHIFDIISAVVSHFQSPRAQSNVDCWLFFFFHMRIRQAVYLSIYLYVCL